MFTMVLRHELRSPPLASPIYLMAEEIPGRNYARLVLCVCVRVCVCGRSTREVTKTGLGFYVVKKIASGFPF